MSSFKNISKLIIAVLAILVLTVGSASAVVPATRTITAGTGSGTAGQPAEVLIPVTIDYPDAVGVGGIAFTITYDPAALTFLGLVQATPGQTIVDPETYAANPVTTGYPYYNPYKKEAPYADRTYTLSANATLFYQFNDLKDGGNNPIGQVLVAGASAEPLTGTTLFKARFLIKSAAVGGLTYPIRLFRSIIKNTTAGYSAAGEFLPILVGTGDKVNNVYTALTFPVIPANLVAGGITVNATAYGIGGTVSYGSDVGPLGAGCTVTLTKETAGGYVFNGQTLVGTNGLYSFSGKYPGKYKITVQSLDPNFDNYETTTPIELISVSITNANAVLPAKPQPVRVSGTVTGTFPSGLLVKVVDPSENVMGTYSVAGDGTWSSALLPYLQSGTYGWYLVYGSMTSSKGATTFSTSGLGTISGSITGITGSASVTAASANGKLQKTVQVSGDGAYPTITNLVPANDYIVSVVATGLPVTYYAGKTDVSQATKVNVTAGNDTGTISFTFVQPTGHITGWIKDSGAGAVGSGPGVEGIAVYGFEVNTFALVQTTTGTGGVYDLVVKAGTYEVFVIKPNGKIFYFYNENGTPTQRESGALLRTVAGASDTFANTNIDIAECDKILTGKVTYGSPTGDPAANVQISAFTSMNRALGLTEQDGRYTVGGLCDQSAYTVEMKPLTGNYPVQTAPVTIGGSNTTKNFIIDTGAVLSGTVKSDDTSPININGAMIFLKDKVTGTLVGGRVYFSASGVYSIRDIVEGSYTLEVTHPDYRSYTVDFLIGSEDMIQNVVLGKGAYFKGTITEYNSDPVKNLAGATVTVVRAGMTSVYAMTNSEGFYSVYGLVEGQSHIVMAQKPGYERQAQTGKIPTTSGTDVSFALAPPAIPYKVSGTVTTTTSDTVPVIAPVIGASVFVSSQSKNFYASATTVGGGAYEILGLANAADYRIVVIPPGNLPTQMATFAVSGFDVTQSFQIALGDSIGGTVSAPGSVVYVFLYKGAEYIGFVETTNGSFTFKGLTSGADYEVLAVASGYVSQRLTSISSGNMGVSITLVTP